LVTFFFRPLGSFMNLLGGFFFVFLIPPGLRLRRYNWCFFLLFPCSYWPNSYVYFLFWVLLFCGSTLSTSHLFFFVRVLIVVFPPDEKVCFSLYCFWCPIFSPKLGIFNNFFPLRVFIFFSPHTLILTPPCVLPLTGFTWFHSHFV